MNLTAKFEELQQLAAALHNQRMAAIAALRAEAAIYSVNQAIWALAGPAPGTSLGDLHTALTTLASGKSISDLVQLWAGQPAAYALLTEIYAALTASGLSQSAANDLLTRLIYQFDTPVVTPTMKELVSNINDDFTLPDIGMCDTPAMSTGVDYVAITLNFVEPFTVATWPATLDGYAITPAYGFNIELAGRTLIQCADWSQYKFYVASNASMFGVNLLSLQRFATNSWITFAGNDDLELFVNGNEHLTVYICRVNESEFGACSNAINQPIIASGWSERELINPKTYKNYETTVYSNAAWCVPVSLTVDILGFVTRESHAFYIAYTPTYDTNLCVSWFGLTSDQVFRVTEYHFNFNTMQWEGGGTIFSTGSPGDYQNAESGHEIVEVTQTGNARAYIGWVWSEFGTPPSVQVQFDIVDAVIFQ